MPRVEGELLRRSDQQHSEPQARALQANPKVSVAGIPRIQ